MTCQTGMVKTMYCIYLDMLICGGKLSSRTFFDSAKRMEKIPRAIAGFMSRSSLPPTYSKSPSRRDFKMLKDFWKQSTCLSDSEVIFRS
ncbi:hypothetical protein WAI453_007184 [Rhynchosporium graminicola]